MDVCCFDVVFDIDGVVVVLYCDFFYWLDKLFNLVYFMFCCLCEILVEEVDEIWFESKYDLDV